jgi:hypothetical protein
MSLNNNTFGIYAHIDVAGFYITETILSRANYMLKEEIDP